MTELDWQIEAEMACSMFADDGIDDIYWDHKLVKGAIDV